MRYKSLKYTLTVLLLDLKFSSSSRNGISLGNTFDELNNKLKVVGYNFDSFYNYDEIGTSTTEMTSTTSTMQPSTVFATTTTSTVAAAITIDVAQVQPASSKSKNRKQNQEPPIKPVLVLKENLPETQEVAPPEDDNYVGKFNHEIEMSAMQKINKEMFNQKMTTLSDDQLLTAPNREDARILRKEEEQASQKAFDTEDFELEGAGVRGFGFRSGNKGPQTSQGESSSSFSTCKSFQLKLNGPGNRCITLQNYYGTYIIDPVTKQEKFTPVAFMTECNSKNRAQFFCWNQYFQLVAARRCLAPMATKDKSNYPTGDPCSINKKMPGAGAILFSAPCDHTGWSWIDVR